MSIYSKEHEFEADKLGILTYHASGYDSTEAIAALNILRSSHLPFDNKTVPNSYFRQKNYLFLTVYFLNQHMKTTLIQRKKMMDLVLTQTFQRE